MDAKHLLPSVINETSQLDPQRLIIRRLGYFAINRDLAADIAAAVLGDIQKMYPEVNFHAAVELGLPGKGTPRS